MPGVRHHARPQAFPHLRKNSEQQTVDRNDDGRSPALIDMRRAENGRGKQDPRRDTARPSAELFLEISTEDDLFANARRDGCENPKENFQMALREHEAYGLASFGGVQGKRGGKKNDEGDEPEPRGDRGVFKNCFRIVPFSADELRQRRAMAFGAPSDVSDDGPFPQNGEDVSSGAMRILDGAHSNSAEVSQRAPGGDHGEQHNGVRRAGDRWPRCWQASLRHGE